MLRLCYAQWQASVKEKNGSDAISFLACVQILLLYMGVDIQAGKIWMSCNVFRSQEILI
jgi:hypothetical protein